MKDIVSNLYNNFLGSLDNQKHKGFSGRKLSAFALIIVVIIVHVKWITLGDFSQLEMVLTIDYSFIAVLFGLTTYSSIKEKPNETDNKPE